MKFRFSLLFRNFMRIFKLPKEGDKFIQITP